MEPGRVTVQGVGSASAPRTRAVVQLGVEVADATVAGAVDGCADAVGAVLAALAAEGFEVRTEGLRVEPRWDPAGNGRRDGHQATSSMSLQVEPAERAGAAVAVAVSAGGDRLLVHGMQLEVADTTAVEEAAREAAWADARARAEQYARLAGRELGDVVEVSEAGGHGDGAHPRAARAQALSVPLAAGEGETTAHVQVVWELA